MFKFDAEKLAKGAKEGLQKAEKLGGSTGEAAKTVLQGLKNVEQAPEQLIEALRKLLDEAKKLAASSGNNQALNTCIQKAEKLLESEDITTEAITKLTAELTALIKGAPAEAPKHPASSGTAEPRPVVRAAVEEKPEAPKEKKVEFTDVDANAYYYEAVQWAVQKGITSGTSETTFSPDQSCTRAQTIVFLWRAAGSPSPKSKENPFKDVKETSHYFNAVLWAAERNIISGDTFNPDAAVTRAQVATFLYRNAGSPAVAASASFTDVPADAYFAKPVAWVAAQGITSGKKDNTFQPDSACTRGQIVTFLFRANK